MQKFSLYFIYSILLFSQFVTIAQAQTIQSYITNEWPDSRYTDHTNETVTDTKTGLMWAKCVVGLTANDCSTGTATTHTWKAALELAEASTTASYSDWRLPNIKEFASLAAHDRFDPAINSALFPNTPSNYHWSSSPYFSSSNGAWMLHFYYGNDNYNSRSGGRYVRLVRGGQ